VAVLVVAVSLAFVLTLVAAQAGASLLVELVIIAASFAGIMLLSGPLLRRAAAPTRIAVIGSSRTTCALATELELSGVTRYTLVGRIATAEDSYDDDLVLGSLDDLRSLVDEHRIDLVLLSAGVSRIAVFDELDRSCQYSAVRLCELCAFYEETFGHIPIADINSAWFQWLFHPRHDPSPPASKRAFDLTVCAVLGLAFLPLLCVIAPLIRRDGGPVFYRQPRIGEGGRVFTVIKLRTMTHSGDGNGRWSSLADDRITPIGRFLRRTHLDELPQLLNVLRGEMSIVGPRPEQPHYVEELERFVPFYMRRHQLRPGLTGWAQIHCGYAGSERGTMWKVSHDLYYLRHRSLALDAKILLATVVTSCAPPQFLEPRHLPFVFGISAELVEPTQEMSLGTAREAAS
jgi:exopolysaccharide biosynthesis polyprenyl glycosylphosphotransferase